jgi:thioredoxin-related protein
MKSITILLIVAVIPTALAGQIESFTGARELARNSGRPILLEFVRDNCLYCALAEAEVDSLQELKEALEAVVFFSVNIGSDEGKYLSGKYHTGRYFPLFILTDTAGEVINRWSGYTSSDRFITSLNSSLKDKITIKERENQYRQNPGAFAALNLAKYFFDSQQYLKSIEYYREAGTFDSRKYHFQIFRSSAVACEEGRLDYDEVLTAADDVLRTGREGDIIYTAKILSNLARQMDKTETLMKYLQKGLMTARQSNNRKFAENAPIFEADLALYHKHDTTRATAIMKQSLGKDWQNEPDQFFKYAEWCLHRRINLNEAEQFARKASQIAAPGQFKGRVLSILAAICHARGKYAEAVEFISGALAEDPGNHYYSEHLIEYRENLKK